MFSGDAVKVLLHLVAETEVQMGQPYTTHEAVMVVFPGSYVTGEVDSNLKDYYDGEISFKPLVWRKTMLSEFLHARNLEAIKL